MRIHSRRKKHRLYLTLVLLLVIMAGMYAFVRMRLEPIVRSLATARVENTISNLINDAVSEEILSGEIDYDRMIYFEKDLDGNITALKTNMSEVNRLKTIALQLLDKRLSDLESDELNIPLGNVLMPTLMSGKGPGIPVRILSASNSDATFTNLFSDAGINQTLHQIQMTISVEVSVILPNEAFKTTVDAQVVVAETVLVGSVPSTYSVIDLS